MAWGVLPMTQSTGISILSGDPMHAITRLILNSICGAESPEEAVLLARIHGLHIMDCLGGPQLGLTDFTFVALRPDTVTFLGNHRSEEVPYNDIRRRLEEEP